jgi:hypothetical protein
MPSVGQLGGGVVGQILMAVLGGAAAPDVSGYVCLWLRARRLDPDQGAYVDARLSLPGTIGVTVMNTGVDVFDTTFQETNRWLKELMERLGTYDRHHAYSILRAVLHALRDRIGPANAVHLGAQLPMLIRGLYYEGWHMGTPTKERHERNSSRMWSESCAAPTKRR